MEHRRERIRCLQELGLHESASEEDIKRAYRSAAIKYHPDKNHGQDTTDKFQQISAAYRFLTEGDSYLQEMQHEARFADINILRFLFPWLFEQHVFFRQQQNPYYDYYDNLTDSDDDDDYDYMPRNTYSAQSASGASEHYRKNANFAQTSTQHGQFFQERKTKGKAAKKKNKDAKRATKLAADKERSESTKTFTTTKEPQARAKSPTPDLPGKQQAQNSPSRQDHEKSQTPDSGSTSNSTEARKDNAEEQTNKKSKKQIQMEQKLREKQLKEINEDLLRQEKEKREKLEKKRLAQEEKEQQEREAREKEEKEREEEERKRTEELRKLLETKEEEKKRKKKEDARMKKLLEEFDSHTFLDDTGDFKYTDPEMKNIICRDDINHLGNANKKSHHEKLETINGLDTASLIKLQEVNQAKEKKQQQKEEHLGSPNHEKLGPIGSGPRTQTNHHKSPPAQQQNHQHPYQPRDNQHPGYQGRSPQHQPHPQHQQHPQQHPHPYPQQHHYQQPNSFYNSPPQPHPTHRMPFWSPTHPPPPLHNNNANIPRPSGRYHPRFANNTRFPGERVYTRTFSSQGFQGRV